MQLFVIKVYMDIMYLNIYIYANIFIIAHICCKHMQTIAELTVSSLHRLQTPLPPVEFEVPFGWRLTRCARKIGVCRGLVIYTCESFLQV